MMLKDSNQEYRQQIQTRRSSTLSCCNTGTGLDITEAREEDYLGEASYRGTEEKNVHSGVMCGRAGVLSLGGMQASNELIRRQ
jgi:hypothetical protein